MKEDKKKIREMAETNLFFLSRVVLGSRFKDLTDFHIDLANYAHPPDSIRRITMTPRGHLKSSIRTVAQTIQDTISKTKHSDYQTLIGMDTASNAYLKGKEIRDFWMGCSYLRNLYPELAPQDTSKQKWNDEVFELINQDTGYRHTINLIGVGGAAASRHFRKILLDDLIAQEAMESEKVMEDAFRWVQTMDALLIEPTKDIIEFICTRWKLGDIYERIQKVDRNFHLYYRQAIENGEPIWPERFPMEYLLELKSNKPVMFATQFMNDPVDESNTKFRISWLKTFDVREIEKEEYAVVPRETNGISEKDDNNEEIVDRLGFMNVVCSTDPASSESSTACKRAIVCVATSCDERRYLLGSWAKVCSETEYINELFSFQQRFQPTEFGVESNANQRWLRYALDQESKKRGVYLPTREIRPSTKQSKVNRITGRLDPIFRSANFYYHPSQIEFVEAIMRFPQDGVDLLDALEDCVELWSTPTKEISSTEEYSWISSQNEPLTINQTTGY